MKCHFIRWNICFTCSVITRWIQKSKLKGDWWTRHSLKEGCRNWSFFASQIFCFVYFLLKIPRWSKAVQKVKDYPIFVYINRALLNLKCVFILVSFVTLIAINGLLYGAYFMKAFMLQKRWKIVNVRRITDKRKIMLNILEADY